MSRRLIAQTALKINTKDRSNIKKKLNKKPTKSWVNEQHSCQQNVLGKPVEDCFHFHENAFSWKCIEQRAGELDNVRKSGIQEYINKWKMEIKLNHEQ